MKLIRHGLVFAFCMYITLTVMVGCAHFHQIIFKNDACIIPVKGYNYRTCDRMEVLIDEKTFIVPKDFETDLASIPRLLWPVLAPQYTSFVNPGILHDYLYRCNNNVTRRYADEVLYSALITNGVTAFTASKFYLAVRLFGGSHFEEAPC